MGIFSKDFEMAMRLLICFQIAAISLAGIGCSDGWQAKTYPAAGRVTINGMAPEGARVHLHPVGKKVDQRNSSPWGIVQKDGKFTLSTYQKGDGAPLGEYKVTLRWPFEPNEPDLGDRLGFAFTTPEKSQWQVTITTGDNELPPIQLTGIKVQTSRPGSSPVMPGKSAKGGTSGR